MWTAAISPSLCCVKANHQARGMLNYPMMISRSPGTMKRSFRDFHNVVNVDTSFRVVRVLKKCWGNLKQKWKNERSDERRKTHKTGGGPPPTPMSAISVLVGAVAGHMATRLDNDNDSDGAAYLPPVQNEPVVRLLEGMVDCDPVYERPRSTCQPVYGRRRARSKFQYRSNYRSSPGSPHRADHTCSCFKLQQRQGGSYSRQSKAAQREDGAFRAGSLSRE
ncbi:hypothetical protein HPB47_013311 [Ixodes persulcatus]|uniref:Uncharacterized protein n=1 Tax=Ixodes persulcatus TaxID=34615 RepID=A0AC60R243_IXOPE|nr:hypothetical protein HPB47_013311 [Ixodes persulcatus]